MANSITKAATVGAIGFGLTFVPTCNHIDSQFGMEVLEKSLRESSNPDRLVGESVDTTPFIGMMQGVRSRIAVVATPLVSQKGVEPIVEARGFTPETKGVKMISLQTQFRPDSSSEWRGSTYRGSEIYGSPMLDPHTMAGMILLTLLATLGTAVFSKDKQKTPE